MVGFESLAFHLEGKYSTICINRGGSRVDAIRSTDTPLNKKLGYGKKIKKLRSEL